MPGSGGVAHRTPLDLPTKRVLPAALLAPAVAVALVAGWLLVGPRTPDLAGQAYRVTLFHSLGAALWDEHWYGGHDLPGYSVLFPPVAALIGLRLTACLSVLASAALFGRLAHALYGPSSRWGAALFALAAAADVWIGRLAFALGVSLALGAALALLRGRAMPAGLLAAACAAASPVAGVLLALAGITHALAGRRPRPALVLAAPAAAVAGVLAALFGEGGSEPYPLLSLLATLAVVGAFLLALPRGQPLLASGALIYLLACVLCVAIPTPMGSNIERYAVLLAGPLLLCASAAAGSPSAGGPRMARGLVRLTPALAAALCAWLVWVLWGPVRETAAVAGNESTRASYYAPVERFLARANEQANRGGVPTRSHWEAALLAPTASLARGWEKQLDERYDRVLLAPGLTAASYGRWLRDNAVAYVALPDAPLDPSSAAEGRLIAAGLPYLRRVRASSHWRIYAVADPAPLLSGPGRLTSLGHDSIGLRAYRPGRFVLRVRYSRYLTVGAGRGCATRAAGGWTSVIARAPGPLVVRARFSLARALGLQPACGQSPGG
jgi:hypothetical protein